MTIIYTRAVIKDVRKVKDKKVIAKVESVLAEIEKASDLNEIQSLKKLSGHPAAYRIRIGTYRFGIYYEDGSIVLARFLKRNDIYKVFP